MDDAIDSFHKQRDIIPLDVDADVGELSDDEEEPIFDDEAINNDEDEHDDEDEDDDDSQDNGLAAKIIKQQKFLRAKFGDFDDELQDEEEDEEGAQNIVWSGNRSHDYHVIKQQTFLRAKFGDFDDELQDEEEDEEGAQNIVWSGNRSHDYHGGDNRDIEAFCRGWTLPNRPVPRRGKLTFPKTAPARKAEAALRLGHQPKLSQQD